MALAHPELIFVAGPEKGRRAAIRSNLAVAGRLSSADIQLAEQYVSRQQFQLTFTTDGWVIENLSMNPIRINGKKFKRRKRVIVETGDVIATGIETEMLFVAQGDDSEEALAAYHARRAAEPTEAAPADAAPAEEAEGEQLEAPAPVDTAPAQGEQQAPVVTEGDQAVESPEETERKAKLKKYGIMFGAYVGLLVAVGIAFWLTRNDGTGGQSGLPVVLKSTEIKDALTASAKPRVKDLNAAAEALKMAKAMYQDAAVKDGALYKSVKYFKLHKAYKRGHFSDLDDDLLFEQAEEQLVEKAQREYRNAVIFERNKQWREARLLFEKLLRMVPAKDEPEPEEDNVIFDNVTRHLVYVKSQARRAKEKPGSPF